MKRLIIAASIENDVHVAGVYKFLRLAESEGFDIQFLGPATPIDKLVEIIRLRKPDIVGISYRLTPDSLKSILDVLKSRIKEYNLNGIRWIFGGTEPNCIVAKESGIFEEVFDGTSGDEFTISYLKGQKVLADEVEYGQDIVDRIERNYPYPIIRHHFGLPSYDDTLEGVKRIAEEKVLDVISIAPDQNTQEHFFDKKYNKALDGAGGVPIRTEEEFKKLYDESRRGNYPLLRCYSGTNDVFKMAKILKDTINNAWAAIPLCWYNVLDGRGPRQVEESIRENQKLMKWHADRNIPVEVNEAHHWGLRDAHDAIYVAASYLAAYNAKKMGVKNYIAQFMFNVPPTTSPKMDLAKMLASIELVESLQDDNFRVFRQARAGLASMPQDLFEAKGQLASSAYLSMAIKPHIYHVVGFCEAHHAATPDDIIESVKIVKAVIKNTLSGMFDFTQDLDVLKRKEELVNDAMVIINAIKELNTLCSDPLSDPHTLSLAIKLGILDAPHLKGNKSASGSLQTKVINGACYAFDYENNRVIEEEERVFNIIQNYQKMIIVA
ncbi:cobalamin B12-binding domain-containing protein [Thermoanaerobacterium thermosaccharolyticum]|uniref:cobalamin B12-binding domain-containing protein n=1 Tax=Thermoanaerobacterium thermosaccharolyticum TaxID=1517 RepID=UPI001780BA3F|nr:cobalamin B12-binding domain-containing protein [Thermoanaerobacterium thermosaccharolyticum]MBE0068618.1 cobalamin B12-binding domain-containing protein [Thermoanaerobacterium thermosaccharolyticum]MBE0228377.1 cobalamin B12-binding domain-containing protein [Thermoanaerobacterium thermosaccharolyticum]